jgi:hypothetical protein
LIERKVLKVNTPQPPLPDMGMMQDPSMQPEQGMMPPMDGNMPMPQDGMQDPNMMGGGSVFDTNFDPGVEADENTDPKKFIQQLTGKLSQSLRTYNDEQGQPDVDLNKYVAGMINKQATEGLSEEDVEEILTKIQSDEPIQEPPMDNGMQQQGDMMNQPTPPQQPQQGQGPQPSMQPNESILREEHLDEIINTVLNATKDDEPIEKRTSKKNTPFSSPFRK